MNTPLTVGLVLQSIGAALLLGSPYLAVLAHQMVEARRIRTGREWRPTRAPRWSAPAGASASRSPRPSRTDGRGLPDTSAPAGLQRVTCRG